MPEHEEWINNETVVLTEIRDDKPRKASLTVRRPDVLNEPTVHATLYDRDGITTDWVVGEKYEFQNIELKSRTGDDPGLFFSGHKETSVNRLTYDAFDFLVVGDTHFGYQNRNRTNPQWRSRGGPDSRYRDGYEFDALESIVDLAERWGVDAILHTGDMFDHEVTSQQYSTIEHAFQNLGELDINIFFVAGNHDMNVRGEISSITTMPHVSRIDKKSNWGTICGFNVIGQAYNNFVSFTDFDWAEFESQYGGPNMLLAHPKENPPLSRYGFKPVLDEINEDWIMFLGHHHEEESFNWGRLQVIYTGFPAKLNDGGRVLRARGARGEYNVSSHKLRPLANR